MAENRTLYHSVITQAIERSLHTLHSSFRRTDEGDAGWYHYLDDPVPGVTASAVGLYVFGLAGTRFQRSKDVLRYLASQQVASSDPLTDGGWPVRTTHGFPVVEATAWVTRLLGTSSAGPENRGGSLTRACRYLERNQNTDFGWASYEGQPSRVFHTALTVLALRESGGDPDVIENGQKWLISAQSPRLPAWGALPASEEPSLLHTSFALMALCRTPGSLTTSSLRSSAEWILDGLTPGEHTEKLSTVEEFDVPFPYAGNTGLFQNSLPHFAGPLAVRAVLEAGIDPLHPKIFDALQAIIDDQIRSGPCAGAWELPRSPTRPSVWALWPFVSALAKARATILTAPGSQVTLLFPGGAILQQESEARKLTRSLLLRNRLSAWVKFHKRSLSLTGIALLALAVCGFMVFRGDFQLTDIIAVMVIPTFLLVFQLIWGRKSRSKKGR